MRLDGVVDPRAGTYFENVDSHIELTAIVDGRFVQESDNPGVQRLVTELQHVPNDQQVAPSVLHVRPSV